ncbi:unnamed protein product [Paramecium sonneborni]|uniref:Uncharacterized protein n=1 Tax=Paramecium sonneborni TaxID=65129 RepID=A0A8S1RQG0_9CILI|nr:unnamed protein product [Paramecium sonneborni]
MEEEKIRERKLKIEEENKVWIEQEKNRKEEERELYIEEEKRRQIEQEKIRKLQIRKQQFEEENRQIKEQRWIQQEKIRQEKLKIEEANRLKIEQENIRQEQNNIEQKQKERRIQKPEEERIKQQTQLIGLKNYLQQQLQICNVKQNIEGSNPDDQKEYIAYFNKARDDALLKANQNKEYNNLKVTLSIDDFNPKYNMNRDDFCEKEQKGSPYGRYDYYFPKGCQGLGLNVEKYGKNQDWIQMDGNSEEWRILYHGTKNFCVNSIVKNNLKPGKNNGYKDHDCKNEFGEPQKAGIRIYFSDKINVCLSPQYGYAPHIQVGEKQFAVLFMTRVNPKKIRQSISMQQINYFVVNESKDVRPYRILLHEKK